MCDVFSMIKCCEVWNIARVDEAWAGRKVLFVVYVAKVLRWFIVHYKLAMVGAPQGAMRVASQIWQVVFASQTLEVFCLALRKKAQYVVVMIHETPSAQFMRFIQFVLRESLRDRLYLLIIISCAISKNSRTMFHWNWFM